MNPSGFLRLCAIVFALAATSMPHVRGQSSAPAPQKPTDIDSAAAIASTSSMEVLDDKHALETGDILAFRIVEDRSGLFSLVITDLGEVEVPYIGRVYAKGKTCKALAYEIKAELEKEHYQQATVIIGLDWLGTRQQGQKSGSGNIFSIPHVNVWGAVNREGPVALPEDATMRVADAILAAGGFTPFAKRKKVKIIRQLSPDPPASTGENPVAKPATDALLAGSANALSGSDLRTREFEVNLKDIMEKGRINQDIVLQPNDIIIVEEKLFNF